MRSSPSIAPGSSPDDTDVYVVLDDFGGRLGRAWREIPEERADRESVLIDLLEGQFSNPVKIVAFNTEAGTARDVSREFSDLIRDECRSKGDDVPNYLQDFVERS
jgi:hypothetical protein